RWLTLDSEFQWLIRENVAMQANRRMRQRSSYRCSALLSKRRSQSGLDRLLAEAPGGEVAGRPRAWAAPLDQPPGALGLGLQRADGLLRQAFGTEPVPDRLVAVASGSERLRPHQRDPLVVDEACPFEHRERLDGGGWRNGVPEPFRQPPAGGGAVAGRPPPHPHPPGPPAAAAGRAPPPPGPPPARPD